MDEDTENPIKDGKKTVIRNPDGTIKSGVLNPKGKPIGTRSFTTKVREALSKIAEGKDYTYEEAFIKAILKKSIIDQDVSMMKTVWEQLDGRPLQKTEITGKDGGTIDLTSDSLTRYKQIIDQLCAKIPTDDIQGVYRDDSEDTERFEGWDSEEEFEG